MESIGCTISKVLKTEIEVLFSKDIDELLNEKDFLDIFNNQEFWIVESPLGTNIPNSYKYDRNTKVATIKLERPLTKGDWIRFRLVRDKVWPFEDQILAEDTTRVGGPNLVDDSNIGDAIQDLSSYPFPVTDGTPAQPVSGGISGPASLSRLVDSAMKTALGRLPKAEDTRSFVGALNQSFKLSQTEGHTVVEWTPHALSGTTDLGGGVTGAQASLAAFAQNALKATLPLVDGLYSLLPDPDPQEVEAARSILRAEWIELVEELGTEGGPRVPRVNQLFDRIGRYDIPNFGRQLGMIKLDQNAMLIPSKDLPFSIDRKNVITSDEELNLTNFIALKDYIYSVKSSWENYLASRKEAEDLGTGLVLLARALSVVAEQVAEVYASMDSVFVGPAERQVINLKLSNDRTMTIEELLSWVDTFASEEAPGLIQDGGLRGVQAIQPTIEDLLQLVQDFVQQVEGTSGLPDGLHQRRVTHTLNELVDYLSQVDDRIKAILPPIKAIPPPSKDAPSGEDAKLKNIVEKWEDILSQLEERIKNIASDGPKRSRKIEE